MPVPFLIIDGYNLIHATGWGRSRYGPGDLERCRSRLLNWLANRLDEKEQSRTTVVFDARNRFVDQGRNQKIHGMPVLFADPESDADSLIEQLIAKHSSPRQILVISSDRRLQRAARRRRGHFVDSETFFDQLETRGSAACDERNHRDADDINSAKFANGLTEEETAEWMEFFGELPDE